MAGKNFRSLYYTQLGFRSVEEKKELEHLLNHEPIDKLKLSSFTQQFTIPAVWRLFVWKVLLNIIPPYKDSVEYVWHHRQGQFHDLEDALVAMEIVTKTTSNGDLHKKLVFMYLLENGMLSASKKNHSKKDSKRVDILSSICRVVCEIVDDEVEAYWVATRFFQKQFVMVEHYRKYPDFVLTCLKAEDVSLHDHLQSLQVLKMIPYANWFENCCAQMLAAESHCLERIWDKIIAGSSHILVCVCVSWLLTCSTILTKSQSTEAVLKILNSPVPAVKCRTVVDKTLELWDANKNSLRTELGDHTAEEFHCFASNSLL